MSGSIESEVEDIHTLTRALMMSQLRKGALIVMRVTNYLYFLTNMEVSPDNNNDIITLNTLKIGKCPFYIPIKLIRGQKCPQRQFQCPQYVRAIRKTQQ
jgi:hypothetical protein